MVKAQIYANAGNLTAGLLAQFSERLLVEVGGVGIEFREHAFDGVFQQRAVVYWFNVGGADLFHDFGEGAQVVQRNARALRSAHFWSSHRQRGE